MGVNTSNSDKNPAYFAFFDLDDTLLSVNSGRVLVREAYRLGLMSTKNLLIGLYLSVLYKLNLAHSTRVIEKMALWLKGLEEKKLVELSQSICDKYLFDQISEEMLSEIKIHRSNNAKIVLLSAALPYTCEPIADFLKMDDVICSSLQVNDGILNGLPDGPLIFGSEKRVQVEEYCNELDMPLEKVYCYADSFSDLPVLEIVGNPICVRPDRRLRNIARKRGWRVSD